MQFHVLQYDPILHDWKANRQKVEDLIATATVCEGDFIVLPEMTDTGWSMKLDLIANIGSVDWACTLAKKYKCWIQVGWANCDGGKGKNCATICSPSGEPVGTYAKVFTCNPLGENEYYDAGNELLIVDLDGLRVCPSICYDLRFPELWRPAAVKGVDVFTVSSSWPHKRIAQWRSLLIARAIENQAFVVASNRTGEDTIALWGGNSMIVSHLGKVVSEASETSINTISASIDPTISRQWKQEFPALQDVRSELIGSIKVVQVTA